LPVRNIRLHLCSIFLLCVFMAGCDIVYKFLDKEGAEEKKFIGETVSFGANPNIEELQSLLKLYGYNPGEIDGKMGVNTRNAIEKFQAANGLNVTRKADRQTWEKIKYYQDLNLIKDGKLNVSFIQATLAKAGFDPGPVDGKFGPKTMAAVKQFQQKHNLKEDGKIGYQTLSQLARYLNKQ